MSEQAGMPGELIYEHAVQIRQLFASLDRADNVIEGTGAFGVKPAGFDFRSFKRRALQTARCRVKQPICLLRHPAKKPSY